MKGMTRKAPFLAALFFIITMTQGFAKESDDGKIYMAPGCVYVAPTGIFVNINDEMVAVSGLYADEGGVYVFADSLNPDTRSWRYWKCPTCDYINSHTSKDCLNPLCPTRKK